MGDQGKPGIFLFKHHFINTDLPSYNGYGDYGQALLADLDNDGKLDFVCGRSREPSALYWFENPGSPGPWKKHIVGHDQWTDVGAVAMDVDRDGRMDIVCSGVWFQNPGNPREREFVRHVFDKDGRGAHDVLAADINGDGRDEIVTCQAAENGLRWYQLPDDPIAMPWPRHDIGPGPYGGIAPAGIGDLNGDGRPDIACADTWYENVNGDASLWVAHRNIPFGQVGSFGMCTKTIVADIDGDGRNEIIISDADVCGSRIAILRNEDGKGGQWGRQDLPQSFKYGSLHSLAIADFSGSGRLDILACEQEELLPPGRENPRWVIWESCGGGKFKEHVILDSNLGGHDVVVGDVDGDVDIMSKIWGPMPWNAAGGCMHVDLLENLSGPAR
jgi:hypothetical protein